MKESQDVLDQQTSNSKGIVSGVEEASRQDVEVRAVSIMERRKWVEIKN